MMNEDRRDKLRKIKKALGLQNTVIVTSAEPFAEALETKIEQIKDSLGKGVELTNLPELVEALQAINGLEDELINVRTKLAELQFPSSVSVEGLEALTEATAALNKTKALEVGIKELKDSFDRIHKAAVDDIYARYSFANSAMGRGGKYVGYLAANGYWFIQKIGVDAANNQSSTYAAGHDAYSQNWKVRERLNYQPRDKVTIS